MKKSKKVLLTIMCCIISAWLPVTANAAQLLSKVDFEQELNDPYDFVEFGYPETVTFVPGHTGYAARSSHSRADSGTTYGLLITTNKGNGSEYWPKSGELYIRYYLKYEVGYKNTCDNIKWLWTYYGNGTGVPYDSHNELIFSGQTATKINFRWQIGGSGSGWSNGRVVNYSSADYVMGDWMLVEIYFKLSSGGDYMNHDGIQWLKINGTTVFFDDHVATSKPGRMSVPSINASSGNAAGHGWFQLDDYEIWDGIPGSSQDYPPTVTITSPTSQDTFDSGESTIGLAGTSGDDNGISSISWVNNRGGQGTANNNSGDWILWSIPNISLQEGENVITVTATDTADQTSADTLTVTYSSGDNFPNVAITSPVSTGSFVSTEQAVNLAGTASDDNGLLSISWVNNRGGQGTANNDSGDWTSWSIPNIFLQEGENVITVTATDTVNQTSTDTITVTYTISDTVRVWNATEQAGDSTWDDSWATWCARVLIEGDSITQSGNQIMLGFQGRDSGDYRIRKVSIAEADPNGGEGDVIDSTWTRVTFDGNSDSSWGTDMATVPSGTEKLSDPVYFSIEPGKDYYVTYLLESPSVYLITPSYYRELYFDGVDHANDIDWSGNGHSTYAARLHAIASIYVNSGSGDTTPPGDVTSFTATSGPGQITLTWTNPTDTDFAGVMLRYRTDGTYPQNKDDGSPIPNGNGGKIAGSPGQSMSYTHTNLDATKSYYDQRRL